MLVRPILKYYLTFVENSSTPTIVRATVTIKMVEEHCLLDKNSHEDWILSWRETIDSVEISNYGRIINYWNELSRCKWKRVEGEQSISSRILKVKDNRDNEIKSCNLQYSEFKSLICGKVRKFLYTNFLSYLFFFVAFISAIVSQTDNLHSLPNTCWYSMLTSKINKQ